MKQLTNDPISKDKLKLIMDNLKHLPKENVTYGSLLDLVRDSIYGEKPVIQFTPDAYYKMTQYVQRFDKEIGWHGVVERNGNTFKVTDVLLYPQLVTAATVVSDEDRMPAWAIKNKDITSKIRFQGHSHVNMSVSPSGTDVNDQHEWLSWVDDFYVFMIVNKKGEFYSIIYDKANNLIYEKGDITIEVVSDNINLNILDEIDDNVADKKYTADKPKEKPKQDNTSTSNLVKVYYKNGKEIEDAVDKLVKEKS